MLSITHAIRTKSVSTGTILKLQFPDASQGPTRQTSLSKGGSLEPAVSATPARGPELGAMWKAGLDHGKQLHWIIRK